jgi:hypothetical protein
MTTGQSEHLKKAFLDLFRLTGNISQSCAAAGISRRATVYEWQEHDDDFAAAFREADIEATETLETEARRRAVLGVHKYKPIYHEGQLLEVVEEITYSDTLLIFLLKARAPEKYRERVDVTTGGQPIVKAYAAEDLELLHPA